MGTFASSYVGPYFKIKRKTEEIQKEYKCCDNKSCQRFEKRLSELKSTIKFCPECGQPIQTHSEPDVVVLSFWNSPIGGKNDNLIDISNYDEHLMPGYHIIIPNLISLIPENFKTKDDDDFILIPEMENCFDKIKKDLEDFKENCKKYIPELEEFYGKENIEIHWGIFQYCC